MAVVHIPEEKRSPTAKETLLFLLKASLLFQ